MFIKVTHISKMIKIKCKILRYFDPINKITILPVLSLLNVTHNTVKSLKNLKYFLHISQKQLSSGLVDSSQIDWLKLYEIIWSLSHPVPCGTSGNI